MIGASKLIKLTDKYDYGLEISRELTSIRQRDLLLGINKDENNIIELFNDTNDDGFDWLNNVDAAVAAGKGINIVEWNGSDKDIKVPSCIKRIEGASLLRKVYLQRSNFCNDVRIKPRCTELHTGVLCSLFCNAYSVKIYDDNSDYKIMAFSSDINSVVHVPSNVVLACRVFIPITKYAITKEYKELIDRLREFGERDKVRKLGNIGKITSFNGIIMVESTASYKYEMRFDRNSIMSHELNKAFIAFYDKVFELNGITVKRY